MNALQLPDGHLLVPQELEGENAIGDAWMEVGPDHPVYKEWMEFYKQNGFNPPPAPEALQRK